MSKADDVPQRFYPDTFSPFTNEPTPEKFRIISTDNCGEGIISQAVFKPGELVFCFTGTLTTEMTLYTLQVRPGLHLHDPYFMGKVLHSCDPNMSCDMETRTFTARKEIKPGDYLTMDYDTTEEILFREFTCHCGSPNCRGRIRGSKFRESAPQESLALA